MPNIFCTLAIGKKYSGFARFLAEDLRDFKQTFAVVTDQPGMFRHCRNVVVTHYQSPSFSYHDKRLALRAALDLGDTAIFVDADCAVRFGVPGNLARQAFSYEFPPGFHGWRISPADIHDHSQLERLAESWGLRFDRNQIVYAEGLFAIRKENGKEQRFFEIWEQFYQEAQGRGFNGAYEGVCFGIAAQASGLTCHGTARMQESRLQNILWHTQLNWRRRRLHHLKFKLKSWLKPQPPTDWTSTDMCGPPLQNNLPASHDS